MHPWYAACFPCFWKWSKVSKVLCAWNITTQKKKKKMKKKRKEIGSLLPRKKFVVPGREQVD